MENVDSTIVAPVKSTHVVETFVIPPLVKHPNADLLSLIKIADTDYIYVAATKDWADHVGKLGCWVPPDSIVDTKRPEFAFLGEKNTRVKAKKLRGINSYGILVLAPPGLKPGDNAAEILGVTHYDPEGASKNAKAFGMSPGEVAPPPKGIYPTYDVDAFLKYARKVFKDGETVYVSEKLHGANGRFCFSNEKMHCGSRNEWKREMTTAPRLTLEDLVQKMGDPAKAQEVYDRVVVDHKPKKNMWWSILETIPQIRAFCEAHPGWCLYGEVFGNVKNFRYNAAENQILFRAFDILIPNDPVPRWMDADEFMATCDAAGIPRVPLLGVIPYDFGTLVAMAEGPTTLPGTGKIHIREGCVVKPIKDRWDPALGRVSLKIVSPQFLELN